MMENFHIVCLKDVVNKNEEVAKWFSSKWKIPFEMYLQSIEESQKQQSSIPQWYVVMDKQKIVAGAGVIVNDFHKRLDLTPNICAVYVECAYRNKGIAKYMLSYICNDLKKMVYGKVYLITDHEHFYEKCGFSFYDMVEEDSGNVSRMYCRDLQKENSTC